MSKTPKRHTLFACLNRHPEAGAVLAQAERILKVERIFKTFAPGGLANISRIANVKAETITIHADHSAAASKLKQLTQFLATEFRRRGVECNVIEVRVQPSITITNPPGGHDKPISEQALTELRNAADKLPSTSPLRAALQNLIDHASHT